MRAIKYQVTCHLPDGTTPHQSPEIQAGIIAEVIKHRAPFLFGGGGVQVTVIHDERPEVKP